MDIKINFVDGMESRIPESTVLSLEIILRNTFGDLLSGNNFSIFFFRRLGSVRVVHVIVRAAGRSSWKFFEEWC